MIKSLCHILANGPSAGLVDFPLLAALQIPSIGMNAAYRFWGKIDFRPTFYICMDGTVVRSHAAAIRDLIFEGRIQRFFLREEILEDFPELGGNEKVVWFGDFKDRHLLFQTDLVTTGSWAIRWAVTMGFQRIFISGIDSQYVPVLPEARAATGVELEMRETPKVNPNYFFADYQQQGDKFNIPNDPDYLQLHGGLVHVDALRAVREDLSRLGYESKIIDTSPLSSHGTFPKSSFYKIYQRAKFHVGTWLGDARDADAMQRAGKALLETLQNPWTCKVTVLLPGSLADFLKALPGEDARQIQDYLKNKLKVVEVEGTLRWGDVLRSFPNEEPSLLGVLLPAGTFLSADLCRWVFARSLDFPGSGFVFDQDTDHASGLRADGASMPLQQSSTITFLPLPTACPRCMDEIPVDADVGAMAVRALFQVTGTRYVHADHAEIFEGRYGRRELPWAREISRQAQPNWLGRQEVFRRLLESTFPNSALLAESLANVTELSPSVARVGSPADSSPWDAIFRMAAQPAVARAEGLSSIVSVTRVLTKGGSEGSYREELQKIYARRHEAFPFMHWELSGFPPGWHPADLFEGLGGGQEISQFFRFSPWQTLVHTDKADARLQAQVANFALLVRDLVLRLNPPPALAQSAHQGTGTALRVAASKQASNSFAPRIPGEVMILCETGEFSRNAQLFDLGRIAEAASLAGIRVVLFCPMEGSACTGTIPAEVIPTFGFAGQNATPMAKAELFVQNFNSSLSNLDCGASRTRLAVISSSPGCLPAILEVCKSNPNLSATCILVDEKQIEFELATGDRFLETALDAMPHFDGAIQLLTPFHGIRKLLQEKAALRVAACPVPFPSVSDKEFLESALPAFVLGDQGKGRALLIAQEAGRSSVSVLEEVAAAAADSAFFPCKVSAMWVEESAAVAHDSSEDMVPQILRQLPDATLLVLLGDDDSVDARSLRLVVEALYYQVPVLVAADSQLADIVGKLRCGIAVERTPGAILDAMKSVRDESADWKRRLEAARLRYFLANSGVGFAGQLLGTGRENGLWRKAVEAGFFQHANSLLRQGMPADAILLLLFLDTLARGMFPSYAKNIEFALKKLPVFARIDPGFCDALPNG
jgi:hypothetical protein